MNMVPPIYAAGFGEAASTQQRAQAEARYMYAKSDQVAVETTDTETESRALQAMAEPLRQLGIYSACSPSSRADRRAVSKPRQ